MRSYSMVKSASVITLASSLADEDEAPSNPMKVVTSGLYMASSAIRIYAAFT